VNNVDVVRAAFEAIGRDDIEACVEVVDPEVEFLPLGAALVDGRAYHGHEGVREWDRERHGVWDIEFDLRVFREVGDVVLVEGAIRTRGRSSGVELDTPVSWVIRLRAGRILRVEAFPDGTAARAAAGLAEPS
jgi:ketosteroid isomerase-like protein